LLHESQDFIVLEAGHFAKYIINTGKIFKIWCWRRIEKISWPGRV